MLDHDVTTDTLTPSGRFYANSGPLDGPIVGDSPALGVVLDRRTEVPVGIAFPVGVVEHRGGPAAVFRLVFTKGELPGRWICVGREFVQLGEAAEEL